MINLMVTLWPDLKDFPHFPKFSNDNRLDGIRLNSAMINNAELKSALDLVKKMGPTKPLWFDVKARQLRIETVNFNEKYLDITLNHPIQVKTPTPVLFKAGEDEALLLRVEEGGCRLIFQAGAPHWLVRPGESLHIRHPSLKIGKPLFTEKELAKIEQVKAAGFTRYFLSYVGSQKEVDQFLELVGKDVELYLKIEDLKGLEFVAREYKKTPNIHLVAACGDMYVEVPKPHDILPALQLIIEKDPEALAGSRILLSTIKKEPNFEILEKLSKSINTREMTPEIVAAAKLLRHVIKNEFGFDESEPNPIKKQKITCNPVPSFADFGQLAWLSEIGYKNMMLCDEICLHDDLLTTAIGVFDAFRNSYKNSAKG